MESSGGSWLSVTTCLVAGVVTLVVYILWRVSRTLKTFEKLGIPSTKPWPIFDNGIDAMKYGFVGMFERFWKQHGKIYGLYINSRPALVVGDLDLLKDILVKKFQYFPNRTDQGSGCKPWKDLLTTLRDDHWKHVRSALSPTFSSGKLKKMMPAIQGVLRTFGDYLDKKADSGEPVEIRKMCELLAMDIIAAVGYGLDIDSLNNPDETFIKHAGIVVDPPKLTFLIMIFFPKLFFKFQKLGIGKFSQSTEFFMKVTEMTLKDRNSEKNVKRRDFLQLLMEAEREGSKTVDAEINHGDQLTTSSHWTRKGLSNDEMQANAFLFLLAGYDTISTVTSFTLFCLAQNPECLKKAQQEVDEKLGKDIVDYETANDLTYLEMCISETLRLYPPGFVLDREATEDVEVGWLHIKKGMQVLIPCWNIHRDPDHWPEPEKFDPERFTAEARASRHSMAYLPFGFGPRNCIGMRLAQLEVRMTLATALQHCTPAVCEKTVYPPKLKKIRMQAVDGAWVKLEPRSK